MAVQGAVHANVFMPQPFFDEFVAGVNVTGIFHQGLQQGEFGGGEFDNTAVYQYLPLAHIQLYSTRL